MGERPPRAIRLLEDPWSTARHIVESVAILSAGLWAFYTFIYAERIKPAQEPAALVNSITVHRLGRDARREILGIACTYANTGKTEIDVAADAVNVWGVRYGARERTSVSVSATKRSVAHELPVVSRRVIEAFVELRDAAAGGLTGHHIILEPGESITVPAVVAILRGSYDLIHAQTIAVPIKMPVTAKARVTVSADPAGAYYLHPPDGLYESDNTTDFSLVP